MKYIRAMARVDPDEAPPFFNLLAHNPNVEEARVLEVNTTLEGAETFLFAIDGDPSVSRWGGRDPGGRVVEVSPVHDGTAYGP